MDGDEASLAMPMSSGNGGREEVLLSPAFALSACRPNGPPCYDAAQHYPDDMPPMASFTARVVASIAAVDPASWDACANPPGLSETESEGERYNPFMSHAFLNALEASGSVGGRTGWTPAHVVVEDSSGRVVAAAASYLKSHSMGEYVFDHAWADAYERAGGRYYPKVQVAAPFTLSLIHI